MSIFKCQKKVGTAKYDKKESFVLNKYCHRICTYNAAVCAVECQMNGCSLVLGSVYMPCDDSTQEHADHYEAAVDVLQCLLDRHIGSNFVFGGNFNTENVVRI